MLDKHPKSIQSYYDTVGDHLYVVIISVHPFVFARYFGVDPLKKGGSLYAAIPGVTMPVPNDAALQLV